MILAPPLWQTDAWAPNVWADGTWATEIAQAEPSILHLVASAAADIRLAGTYAPTLHLRASAVPVIDLTPDDDGR